MLEDKNTFTNFWQLRKSVKHNSFTCVYFQSNHTEHINFKQINWFYNEQKS